VTKTRFGRNALSGAFWMGLGFWCVAVVNFVTMVILARALSTVEYGLVAVVTVVARLIEATGTVGFQAAVVQRREELDDHRLNVAWTGDRLMIKTTMAVALALSAPAVARFFHAPQLTPVFWLLAVFPLLQGLESNAIVVLTRQLEYRRRTLLDVSSGVASALVIPFVIAWPSVWVFVLSVLFGQLVRTAISYVLHPKLPRPTFDWATMRELFGFGKWVLGLQFLQKLKEQVDKLLLGTMLGPLHIGYFQLGNRLGTQIVASLDTISVKVLFPIYARMQEDREGSKRRYAMVLQLSFLLIVPACVFVAVLARPLVAVLFGEKWLPAVPVVQLLSVAGAIKVLVGTGRPLLRGLGRPGLEFAFDLVLVLTLVPLVIVFTWRAGFVGTAWAVLLAYATQLPIWLWSVRKVVGLQALEVLWMGAYPLAAAAGAGLFGWWLIGLRADASPLSSLLLGAAGSGAAYLAALCAGWPFFRWPALNTLFSHARSVWQRRAARRRNGLATNG
jgi:O-antigen/teichoic acid export membrane protein